MSEKFTCQECQKSFDTNRQLGSHLWAKHGIKGKTRRESIKNGVQCLICHDTFKNHQGMRLHMTKKHSNTLAKTNKNLPELHTPQTNGIQCPIEGCNHKPFDTRRGLGQHLYKAHNISIEQFEELNQPKLQKTQIEIPVSRAEIDEFTVTHNVPQVAVNFCPNCGCSLNAYNMLQRAIEIDGVDENTIKLVMQRVQDVQGMMQRKALVK